MDTRDPEGGSAWTFFNQNLIEEIQIGGLGAPAEYGGFTGAIINTVTKSGGNAFSGLFSMRYTDDSLACDNIVQRACSTPNPRLGEAAVTKKLTDYTVQMGGPIKKDKAFFFASVQRYSAKTDPTGPVANSTDISPRFNMKVTLQPIDDRHHHPRHAVRQLQRDRPRRLTGPRRRRRIGRPSNEDAPEWVWNAQWQQRSARAPCSRRSSPATTATTTSIPSIRRRSPTTPTPTSTAAAAAACTTRTAAATGAGVADASTPRRSAATR